MGNGAVTNAGAAVVMEGIHASVGALDALFLEEARLDVVTAASGPAAPAGPDPVVDVLQRKIDNRLERLAVVSRLEAQLAAAKARDAAEILELQHAMIPPNASLQDRSYQEMSIIEEIAGVLTVSSPAAGALIS